MDGDTYIAELAAYIRSNAARLAATGAVASSRAQQNGNSWTGSIFGNGSSAKPLMLTTSLYHLYYVLLRVQEAGFADIGDLDVPFSGVNRRPASAAIHKAVAKGHLRLTSDASSVRTGWASVFSSSATSTSGSSWWGLTGSSAAPSPATSLDANLRFIYTAFTILPSLRVVMRDTSVTSAGKGKHREVDSFAFEEYPGDRRVPLRAFKSLQRLELSDVDARIFIFDQAWTSLRALQIRNCGLESPSDILVSDPASGLSARQWSNNMRSLDLQSNDIPAVDVADLEGLDRLSSLNLRRNLLIEVPTALASLTSLRSLDLSGNMIESVLYINKALGALTVLNLRGNRISSLCGLERLFSLEVLDLRDNLVDDVSELSRLVTLPHLSNLFVSEGNPFSEDPSRIPTRSGNGWRIDLFQNFLDEGRHHRKVENLPQIDGSGPSWNESRYLEEHRKAHQAVASRPKSLQAKRDSAIVTPTVIVSPRKARQEVSAPNDSGGSKLYSVESINPHHENNREESMTAFDTATEDATKPKVVKKKHRRIVDLDGQSEHDRAFSQHRRAVSSPGDGNVGNSDALAPRAVFASTVSSVSPSKKTRSRLRSEAFEPLQPATKLSQNESGSGSEAEEFRKRMEKLRQEVGSENWLSVYTSSNSRGSTQ